MNMKEALKSQKERQQVSVFRSLVSSFFFPFSLEQVGGAPRRGRTRW